MDGVVVPSYPYIGSAAAARIMQDASSVPPTSNGSAPSRMNKRRKVDDAYEDRSSAPTAYNNNHWSHDDHHDQPFTLPGQDGSSYSSAPADFSNQSAAASALGGSTEGSSWQHSETPAYPDLGSYHQQPYFYQQTTNQQPQYNSTWAPPATSQPFGDNSSASYSAPEQPTAPPSTMPYFPPQPPVPHTNGEGTENAIDAVNPFEYNTVDAVTAEAYASFSQPSATAALAQREAAKSSAYYFDDASMHLKIQSLPILDNLATQLIHTISKASFPQIQDLMRGTADSEDGQAYKTLKNLFDQTRKVYSRETPFIDAIAIQMFQPNQQEIIRKANIATFISSILGAHDVSFFHLNEFFMETFVPLGHRLLKWQGAIYLELKTQIYISALMNSDGSPEAMLDELFPPDLDAQILTRHPDAPSLSPSEQDFIDRSRARKSYLLAEPASREALQELPKKYQWNDFVREFASCITKNVDGIMNVPVRSQAGGNASGGKNADVNGANSTQANGLSGVPALNLTGNKSGSGTGSESRKSAPAASTIRQPWTKPEEDALLAGLERVNGPHWSQILALYGRGGSVSEVLKDRNQVQLKDKARNLKLWYLKTGKEVPPALRGVTGELRKRGGARARAALGLIDDDEQQQGGGDDEDGEGGDAPVEKDTGKKSRKKSKK